MPTYNDSSIFYGSSVPYSGSSGDTDFTTPRTESEVLQPAFIRRRFAYRTPMNSLRFNQDAAAFRFDIVRLYDKYEELSGDFDEDYAVLFSDQLVSESLGTSWSNTIGEWSLTELSLKLDKLNKRLSLLEKNRL
jgi:hypothetical protein